MLHDRHSLLLSLCDYDRIRFCYLAQQSRIITNTHSLSLVHHALLAISSCIFLSALSLLSALCFPVYIYHPRQYVEHISSLFWIGIHYAYYNNMLNPYGRKIIWKMLIWNAKVESPLSFCEPLRAPMISFYRNWERAWWRNSQILKFAPSLKAIESYYFFFKGWNSYNF